MGKGSQTDCCFAQGNYQALYLSPLNADDSFQEDLKGLKGLGAGGNAMFETAVLRLLGLGTCALSPYDGPQLLMVQ